MQAAHALRDVESPRWAVGWVRPGHARAAIEVATGWGGPVLAVVDDADLREGLDAYPQISVRVLRDVLVFTMLIGARTHRDAHELLPLLHDLQDASTELVDRLIVWLHLYDRVTGFYARPHLPAVFAEHLACDALAGDPHLAAAVALAARTPERAISVLTLLARAATHTSTALSATTALIDADPHRLLPVAIRIALAGHCPIDTAIAAAVEHHDPAWDTASTLHQLLPDEREVLNRTQIAVARACATRAPTTLDRADALTALANAWNRTDRHAQAVAAATDAVTLWRQLAAADPAAYQRYVAGTLITLTDALGLAGRDDEAIAAATESVTLLRQLADADPVTHQPFLGGAFATLAEALRVVGRHDEAVGVATDAVTLRRQLAAADPVTHQPYLADAWTTLAQALRVVGRYDEAVRAATEAVALRRGLEAAEPDVGRLYLANALTILALVLGQVGRYDEAVGTANRAVDLRRQLVRDDPAAHPQYLANALVALSDALRRAGRYGEAVIAATEAVAILRELAHADPTAHQRYLANGLNILALGLNLADRYTEAATPPATPSPSCAHSPPATRPATSAI